MNEDDDFRPGEPEAPAPVAAAEPVTRELGFAFHGSGAEYFRIWIVNLLLSIVTLGIYSAWAKVRRLRYFHGNTRLDGSAFGYHADPVKILKGRLMAAAFFLAYSVGGRLSPVVALVTVLVFAALLPWIVVRSRSFQLANTSYRNIRFGFERCYRPMTRLYYGGGLLVVVTLGLALPWWQARRHALLVRNSRFGRSGFEPGFRPRQFYAIYGKAALLAIPVMGLALALLAAALAAWQALGGPWPTNPPDPSAALLLGLGSYAVLLPAMLLIAAYSRARILNTVYSGTRIGQARLDSRLRTWPLYRLYLGNLAAIVLTLGLFIPWARVRMARYRAQTLVVLADAPIDAFLAAEGDAGSAVGEEIGDFFDVDFGL